MDDPLADCTLGTAECTAQQTAWLLMTLIKIYFRDKPAINVRNSPAHLELPALETYVSRNMEKCFLSAMHSKVWRQVIEGILRD